MTRNVFDVTIYTFKVHNGFSKPLIRAIFTGDSNGVDNLLYLAIEMIKMDV